MVEGGIPEDRTCVEAHPEGTFCPTWRRVHRNPFSFLHQIQGQLPWLQNFYLTNLQEITKRYFLALMSFDQLENRRESVTYFAIFSPLERE